MICFIQIMEVFLRKVYWEIDLIELQIVLQTDTLARIGVEILFLAFRQKKIETDSRK